MNCKTLVVVALGVSILGTDSSIASEFQTISTAPTTVATAPIGNNGIRIFQGTVTVKDIRTGKITKVDILSSREVEVHYKALTTVVINGISNSFPAGQCDINVQKLERLVDFSIMKAMIDGSGNITGDRQEAVQKMRGSHSFRNITSKSIQPSSAAFGYNIEAYVHSKPSGENEKWLPFRETSIYFNHGNHTYNMTKTCWTNHINLNELSASDIFALVPVEYITD